MAGHQHQTASSPPGRCGAADVDGLTERELYLCEVAAGIASGGVMPDDLDDCGLTEDETRIVWRVVRVLRAAWANEERAANAKARRLLRSYLSPVQRRQLRTRKNFLCVGSQGGVYRLLPRWAGVERVERHGQHWFARASYCLHDFAADSPDRKKLPAADVSLSHLLLLSADEGAFLAAANRTDRTQLWNGAYLRRLREARLERAA